MTITATSIATRGRAGQTNAVLIGTYGRVVGAVGAIIREALRLYSYLHRTLSLRSMIDEDN